MRLIDADELIEYFERLEDEATDGTENDGSDGTTRIIMPVDFNSFEIKDIIDYAPTVEVYKNIKRNDQNLRPCIANDKKALFHRWGDRSEIVEPSWAVGGHKGGVIKWTVGIVEFEDGKVGEALPQNIRFINYKKEDGAE